MNAITIYWLVFIAIFFIVYAIDLSSAWNWWNDSTGSSISLGYYLSGQHIKWHSQKEDENVNPESNVLYKLASRFFRIDPDVHSPRFSRE